MLYNESGLNVIAGPGGKFVSIDSERLEESMQLFMQEEMAGIHISAMGAYKAKDLEFLQQYADVVHAVLISDGRGIDVSGLAHLNRLDYLTLDDFAKPVRLPSVRGLTRFAGKWSEALEIGPGCDELRRLSLTGYRAKNLDDFPMLPRLQELDLVQSTIESVDGCQRIKHVEALILHRCAKLADLQSISLLAHESLMRLSLEYCKKIQSYEPLSTLSRLTTLNIQFCSDLPDLEFLRGCDGLTGFGCYGTKLLKLDLAPLRALPNLTFAGLSHQRNLKEEREQLADFLARKVQG